MLKKAKEVYILMKNYFLYLRTKWLLYKTRKGINWIIKDIGESLLSKKQKKMLSKAYYKHKDIKLGKSWGWEWEEDHFHTQDNKVIRRADYLKN